MPTTAAALPGHLRGRSENIIIENNIVTGSDLGIEVGAENRGVVASGIIVRNNVVYKNEKSCLVFGGFDASAGRVRNSQFLHNTCYGNDTLATAFGELWIQYAEDNAVRGNIFNGLGRSCCSPRVVTSTTPWTTRYGTRPKVPAR